MAQTIEKNEPYQRFIVALSVLIPLVVAILFKVKVDGYDFSFLPPIYASINAVTAVLLIAALFAIKNKKIRLHERIMKVCIALSVAFLIMYVIYHMTSDPTIFGASGAIKYLYYFILISHISLSIATIPLVMFTFVRALSQDFDRHKKIAKITFPIWLYVATTGVIVYLMISPYYQ